VADLVTNVGDWGVGCATIEIEFRNQSLEQNT
jgi:hypothetical protein